MPTQEKHPTISKRVLMVDDSATVRQHVSKVLTQVGFEILEAADGQIGAGQPASIKKAKKDGAKGWIVKSFNPAQLIAIVQRLAGVR